MKSDDKFSPNRTTNAPGKGSDKQHPETPANANERFKRKEQDSTDSSNKANTDIGRHPEQQDSG